MKLARASVRSSLTVLLALAGVLVVDAMGILRTEAALKAYRWAANAPMLGSFISRAQAEPFAAAVVGLLVGIGLFLLADKLGGIVDLRFEKDAGKQFFWKDSGAPAYYLVQAWFLNQSNDSAEQVSARSDFCGSRRVVTALSRWAMGVTPLATGFEDHVEVIDIAPGYLPGRLNVAVRWPSGTFAFSRENEHAYPDLTHPNFAVDAGRVLVRIRLRGRRARETYWFSFLNEGATPRLKPISVAIAWWHRVRLATRRARSMPPVASPQPSASTSVSDAAQSALSEVTSAPLARPPTQPVSEAVPKGVEGRGSYPWGIPRFSPASLRALDALAEAVSPPQQGQQTAELLISTPAYSIGTLNNSISIRIVNRSKENRAVLSYALLLVYHDGRKSREHYYHSPKLEGGLLDALAPQQHTEGRLDFTLHQGSGEPDVLAEHDTLLRIEDAISGRTILHPIQLVRPASAEDA